MAINKPTLELEQKLGGIVAGVDEAGVGPLAGPVVAAAVILDYDNIPDGINDSKKLNPAVRQLLFAQITKYCHVGIGVASVAEIDGINIYHATRLAMVRAAANLGAMPDHILVDGVRPPKFPVPATSIIKGDTISLSIAAASIIAKVTRDRMMDELHSEFPLFGWDTNRGYSTKIHQQAVRSHGITPHHRRSFSRVWEIYEQWELELSNG